MNDEWEDDGTHVAEGKVILREKAETRNPNTKNENWIRQNKQRLPVEVNATALLIHHEETAYPLSPEKLVRASIAFFGSDNYSMVKLSSLKWTKVKCSLRMWNFFSEYETFLTI
jgi:hypothetical protein